MRKRCLLLVLLISFFILAPRSGNADPTWDGGMLIWPFWQKASSWATYPWANKPYGHPELNETIGDYGCALTSLAMMLRYHGMGCLPDQDHNPIPNSCTVTNTNVTLTTFNPLTLNDWLLNNNGYNSSNGVNWQAIKKFYFRFGSLWGNEYTAPQYSCQPVSNNENCQRVEWSDKAKMLLDNDLTQGLPTIMQIKYPGSESHFVLASGYSQKYKSYRANDPGKSYEYVPAPSLAELYPGGYSPLRIDRYSVVYTRSLPLFSGLSIKLHSPVEIQVVDPNGQVTGYNPVAGTKVNNIPRSSYYEESISSIDLNVPPSEPVKTLDIDEPSSGNYILKVFGTGDGPYTIDIEGTKSDNTINLSTSITGTATPTLAETYRVQYSPTGEAALSNMALSNQPPIANAGASQTGEQSYEIQLDGSGSSDPDGDPITYSWSVISAPADSTATFSNANVVNPIFIPDKAGTYVLQLVVNDHFTDSMPSTVTITATPVQSRISVTPNYSKPLSAGSTTLSFALNNIGRISVSNGTLNINLADPTGATVYTGTQAFTITVGQTKTIDVPLNIPSLKFGNYTLTYTQSDETHTGSPTSVTIANSVLASFSFDKSSYRVRDTANLTLTLMNTGKFNLDAVSVTVSSPDANYSDTRTMTIFPSPQPSPTGGEGVLVYAIPIPETITAGQHDVTVTLSLASGNFAGSTALFSNAMSIVLLQS